jgi:hypothetical protein
MWNWIKQITPKYSVDSLFSNGNFFVLLRQHQTFKTISKMNDISAL